LLVALPVAPAPAGGCSSAATVNAFRGHAVIGFGANNSGPDVGNGGSYTAHLSRSLSRIKVNLDHKKVVRNKLTGAHVIFTGKASGGDVAVDDDFEDTGAMFSGHQTYNGPLSNHQPGFGSSGLFLDLNTCHYKLTIGFAVRTTFTGTLESGSHPVVTGSVYSERKKIPHDLQLTGADGPSAYGGACPGGNPILSKLSCYRYGGGLIGLCSTFDVSTPDCPPDPVGTARFRWVLKPK
jgi:hypothetical protein